jgi:sugar-specific transcriptional regulator TrmB
VTTKEIALSQPAITALEQLGFSTYEARVYLGLLQQNPATGYQLGKLSGVPRSRIYETLERLTAKGFAIALQTDPIQYSPLAIQELLAQLQEHFDGTLSELEVELKKVIESIWNLRGRDDILRRARRMIANAQESIYMVGWDETLRELRPELEAAVQRNIRIVLISCGEKTLDLGSHYHHAYEAELVQQCDTSLNVLVDGMEVLVGQTEPVDSCQAAWSHSSALIFVTEEYIRHEVYLHKIIERLGTTMADELKASLMEGLREVPHTH